MQSEHILFAICIALMLVIIFCGDIVSTICLGLAGMCVVFLCEGEHMHISGGRPRVHISGGRPRGRKGSLGRYRNIQIWHNPGNFDINKYNHYSWMVQKILRRINVTTKHKDIHNNLQKLIKHKHDKKKWGYTDDENPAITIKFKFGDNILKEIQDRLKLIKMPQYLDYGCGNGLITEALHNILGAKSFCIDVDDYRKYKSSSFIQNKSLGDIDNHIPNETLDLISAAQSLHHVHFELDITINDYKKILQQIVQQFYNKLKHGGLLLIREHDVRSIADLYPVLLEHLIYDALELDRGTNFNVDKFISNYHKEHDGWYFSYKYLHSLLTQIGFKRLHFEYKKGNNASRIYNILYVK